MSLSSSFLKGTGDSAYVVFPLSRPVDLWICMVPVLLCLQLIDGDRRTYGCWASSSTSQRCRRKIPRDSLWELPFGSQEYLSINSQAGGQRAGAQLQQLLAARALWGLRTCAHSVNSPGITTRQTPEASVCLVHQGTVLFWAQQAVSGGLMPSLGKFPGTWTFHYPNAAARM